MAVGPAAAAGEDAAVAVGATALSLITECGLERLFFLLLLLPKY